MLLLILVLCVFDVALVGVVAADVLGAVVVVVGVSVCLCV